VVSTGVVALRHPAATVTLARDVKRGVHVLQLTFMTKSWLQQCIRIAPRQSALLIDVHRCQDVNAPTQIGIRNIAEDDLV
jgi:hypothetical protein